MIGPILASFQGVEIEQVEWAIESIGALYRMGKISHDGAVAMLRLEVDMRLYNSIIGRNTNFRFSDHSSVWRNPNRLRFFRRLLARDGNAALEEIRRRRPIFQNQTHDELTNFRLHSESFGDGLRIVEMIRHPVPLIDSWLRRGWGTRFGQDPLAFPLCICYQGQELPYYALGWEDTFISTSPPGRVVRMIKGIWDQNWSTYRSLSDSERGQVFIVPLEDFVERPTPYLEPLTQFVGSSTTRHTSSALKRQRCPREYKVDLQKLGDSIDTQVSEEERALIDGLVEEYESLAGRSQRR